MNLSEAENVNSENFSIESYNMIHPNEEKRRLEKDLMKLFQIYANQNIKYKDANKIIAEYFFNLKKHKIGLPGFQLANYLNSIEISDITDNDSEEIYSQLDTIRTTIRDPEEALLFFYSALALNQTIRDCFKMQRFTKKVVLRSIETIYGIQGKFMVNKVKNILLSDPDDERLSGYISEFVDILKEYKTDSQRYLLKNLLDYVDCAISNLMVSQNFITDICDIIKANTCLSKLEAESEIKLPKFQQILLLLIAYEPILQGESSFYELVPLIPMNIAYLLLCSLRVQSLTSKKIEYFLLEKFAAKHRCDISNKSNDIQFMPKFFKIPVSCSDICK